MSNLIDEYKGLNRRNGKPRIHFTALSAMARCGEQFRRRYVENERRAPGIAAMIGRGTHAAIEADLISKRDTGELLPAEAIADLAATEFQKSIDKDGVHYHGDEIGNETKVNAKSKDQSIALAQLHHQEAAPAIEPKLVEYWWTLELPDEPVDLSGVYDVVEHRKPIDGTGRTIKVLRDAKTAGKSYAKTAADHSEQLTLYALAEQVLTGKAPDAVVLDVLVKNKVPKYQVLESARSPEQLNAQAKRVQRFVEAMKAGVFVPADPESWQCSEKWCGYFPSCPFANRPTTVAATGSTTPEKRAKAAPKL